MVRTSVFADCVTRLIHGRVHVGSKDKQSRPDSSIQAFNLSRNHAHRETQRDPRLHLPISPHAFLRYATFPHMHYVTFPHMHSPTCIIALCDIPPHALCDIPHMHSCVILADCARDSVQHGAQLHTHYIYLQTCEGLGVTRAQLHTHYIIFADLRRDLCN